MICVVCESPNGQPVKGGNGRPDGVSICPPCVEAIQARQVGIVKRPDGSLYITDGRVPAGRPEAGT